MLSQASRVFIFTVLAFAAATKAATISQPPLSSSGCGSAIPNEVTVGGPSYNLTAFSSNSSAKNPLRALVWLHPSSTTSTNLLLCSSPSMAAVRSIETGKSSPNFPAPTSIPGLSLSTRWESMYVLPHPPTPCMPLMLYTTSDHAKFAELQPNPTSASGNQTLTHPGPLTTPSSSLK